MPKVTQLAQLSKVAPVPREEAPSLLPPTPTSNPHSLSSSTASPPQNIPESSGGCPGRISKTPTDSGCAFYTRSKTRLQVPRVVLRAPLPLGNGPNGSASQPRGHIPRAQEKPFRGGARACIHPSGTCGVSCPLALELRARLFSPGTPAHDPEACTATVTCPDLPRGRPRPGTSGRKGTCLQSHIWLVAGQGVEPWSLGIPPAPPAATHWSVCPRLRGHQG